MNQFSFYNFLGIFQVLYLFVDFVDLQVLISESVLYVHDLVKYI